MTVAAVCHREPIWTEPGWDDHSPAELKIDSFQADRSPEGNYTTMNLAGMFIPPLSGTRPNLTAGGLVARHCSFCPRRR